ncbi:hypothetical protein MRB53_003512 [Persea americana]|uniref:Uncharacterized protein n=1 Tax=Persea americana TaxID=3435 RepID=A0ACC2MZ73_PERAE|nr:hypothetical protein MRB53_003512 [Persea americana]
MMNSGDFHAAASSLRQTPTEPKIAPAVRRRNGGSDFATELILCCPRFCSDFATEPSSSKQRTGRTPENREQSRSSFSSPINPLKSDPSQDPFICSRATDYGSPDCLGTPRGACGYREFGKTINGGDVGAVCRLYRNGTRCGACYQVRCTHAQHCTDNWVTIVATDYGEGDHTDFILSPTAFVKLARPNMASELVAYGVVDIEYRRVP